MNQIQYTNTKVHTGVAISDQENTDTDTGRYTFSLVVQETQSPSVTVRCVT